MRSSITGIIGSIAEPDSTPIDISKISGTSAWDVFTQITTLIFIFIVILVLAYYATRFFGKTQGLRLKGTNLEVIETLSIGNGKLIQLVRVGQKYIVIAITKDKIEYLSEVPSEQVMIQEVPKQTMKTGFDEILKKIISKKNDK